MNENFLFELQIILFLYIFYRYANLPFYPLTLCLLAYQ